MAEKKKGSFQTTFEDLRNSIDQKRDKELADRLKNSESGLVIHNDKEDTFYTQDYIEKKTLFLPNTTNVKSFVVDKSDDLKITMGKAGGKEEFGVLKTRHRDALYSVLNIWANNKWPVDVNENGTMCGVIRTSRFNILSNIYTNSPSKRNYETLADTLYELKIIPIETTKIIDGEEFKEVFSIFSGYTLNENRRNEEVEIFLNPFITEKYYLNEGCKLLNISDYKNLRSEIAKTLYPILDRIVSTKGKFKKNVFNLCHENGLNTYKDSRSEIKRKWKKAVSELNEITLSNGKSIEVFFDENENKDLFLVARLA